MVFSTNKIDRHYITEILLKVALNTITLISIKNIDAYGVYISQLIRYSRTCSSYHDFPGRGLLLNQWFLVVKLKSALRTICGHHHVLLNHYGIFVSHDHGYVPFVVMTIQSFPHSWLITGFVTWGTWHVSHVKQELRNMTCLTCWSRNWRTWYVKQELRNMTYLTCEAGMLTLPG